MSQLLFDLIDGTILLKALRVPHKESHRVAVPFDVFGQLGAVKLAVAIGIAYFLAARLGLALTSHAGLAFF
jgi:hypothetical protein